MDIETFAWDSMSDQEKREAYYGAAAAALENAAHVSPEMDANEERAVMMLLVEAKNLAAHAAA